MDWNNYKNLVIDVLQKTSIDDKILDLIKGSKDNNQTIFVAGNGGSAATAAHYTCDLCLGASKDDFLNNPVRYNVVSLTTNMPLIMALANDCGYDQVFKQQLINLAKPNDILIAISGSGNSPNIIEAVKYAKDSKIITLGISGYDGGKLKGLSDYNIHVSSFNMEVCEDVHSIFGHFLAIYLRESERK